jgi:hypothetical protein
LLQLFVLAQSLLLIELADLKMLTAVSMFSAAARPNS